MIVWTFSEYVKVIIFGLLLLIIFGIIIFNISKAVLHKLFYHNCKDCKHCYLKNVASCRGRSDYGCDRNHESLTTKMIQYHEPIWKRCEYFNK